MRFSKASKLIGITLVVYIICDVLLTPLARLETRPLAAVMGTGFAALGLLFIGFGLAVIDLILLGRGSRRAPIVAILAAVLYFPTVVADQAGHFSSLRPPPAIELIELIQAVVALILIGAALWGVRQLNEGRGYSGNVMALAIALMVNVFLVILLTPLGFETRPPSDLKTVGYIAIGTIFAGLILDLASIGLLFRRVRLASSLAIVGSVLFFVPIFGDQTGAFFSLPIPAVVNTLEYIFIVVLLITLVLTSKVYKESNRA